MSARSEAALAPGAEGAPGVNVYSGLLWREWLAHGEIVLGFLAAYLVLGWVLEIFFHPGFVLGFGAIFIVLGASVGLIGTFLRDDIFTKAAGALLMVLGLQLTGVINIPLLQVQRRVV